MVLGSVTKNLKLSGENAVTGRPRLQVIPTPVSLNPKLYDPLCLDPVYLVLIIIKYPAFPVEIIFL